MNLVCEHSRLGLIIDVMCDDMCEHSCFYDGSGKLVSTCGAIVER